MPGTVGNRNASKDKLWEGAVRRAILADDGKRLRAIAERLLDKAAEGDVAAIKEVGDRLDGKPKQSMEHTGEGGGPVKASLTVEFVKSNIDSAVPGKA